MGKWFGTGAEDSSEFMRQLSKIIRNELEEWKRNNPVTETEIVAVQVESEETASSLEEKEMREQLASELKAKEAALLCKEAELAEKEEYIKQIEEKLHSVVSRPDLNGEIKEQILQCQSDLKQMKELMEQLVRKDEIIKSMHGELQMHSRNLYAEMVKPLLKTIIKIHERNRDTYIHYCKTETSEKVDAYQLLLKATESNTIAIRDILEDEYDLEYYEPQSGSVYSPKEHSAIKSVPTNDEELAGKIKSCIYGGFRDLKTGKIMKLAIVEVYKLQ